MHGKVTGVAVGTYFKNRNESHHADIHRHTQAGIAGYGPDGIAESIVVSGGYEDDEDYGDLILYTGEGGRSADTGRQNANQELVRGNLALTRNEAEGVPVRVVRRVDSSHGRYRYDGLFHVTSSNFVMGRSGFRVWRYRLEAAESSTQATQKSLPLGSTEPERRGSFVQRVVRQTRVAFEVKRINDYRCQVCDTRLDLPGGPYAEAAHIKPLGRPHDGPDVGENILCLCPNCHVQFDSGAFAISDSHQLIYRSGTLHVVQGHSPNPEFFTYHRIMVAGLDE